MTDNKISEIAGKFFRNEANAEEIKILMEWYDGFDDNEEEVVVDAVTENESNLVKTRIKNALMQQVNEIYSLQKQKRDGRLVWLGKWPLQKIAVAILFIAAGAWLISQQLFPAPKYLVIAVPKQERKKIVLPDGSVVWVNAATTVKYASNYNSSNREIFLEGEAYFDVKHDTARPFIVRTHYSVTKVLGTAFNIKAYPDDSLVTVTVNRGKVQVEDMAQHRSVLIPDQQLSINTITTRLSDKTVLAKNYNSWINGTLEFNGENFEEVSKILSRRFDVVINLQDKNLRHCTFIAGFEQNDSLPKILDLLCKINNSHFEISSDGKTVSIAGEGCQ